MRTSSKPQIDLKSSTRNLNLSRSDYLLQLYIDKNKLNKMVQKLWFKIYQHVPGRVSLGFHLRSASRV